MTIYLIRHGKTLANERKLYCGSTDLSLSEQGREELNRIHLDKQQSGPSHFKQGTFQTR